MIVKNEENVLERCLINIKDFVDEIIIIDTGSTDKTIDIARKYTNKIHFFEWCDDFSKARNYSLSKATCDWIFILDADNIIFKDDLMLLRDIIKDNNTDLYSITTLNLIQSNFLDKMDKMYFKSLKKFCADGHAYRLFRNKPDIRFEFRVHERMPYAVKRKYNCKLSDITLYHSKKIKDLRKNSKLYYELMIKDIKERKINSEFVSSMLIESAKRNYWFIVEDIMSNLTKIPEYDFNFFIPFYYQLKKCNRIAMANDLLRIFMNSTKNNHNFKLALKNNTNRIRS